MYVGVCDEAIERKKRSTRQLFRYFFFYFFAIQSNLEYQNHLHHLTLFFSQAEVEVTEAIAARDSADAHDETSVNNVAPTPILDALVGDDESEKGESGDEDALLDLDDEKIKDHASLCNDSESDQGSQENPPTESKVQWSDEEDD